MPRPRPTASPLDAILTPDGRYIVVRDRLWRATSPALPAPERTRWTRELMAARRAVGSARRIGDKVAMQEARLGVERAKRALGERGPVWWCDGSPDYNRRLVKNTPYQEWYERAQRNAAGVLRLLDRRDPGASVCPSEVARSRYPRHWRRHLDDVREVARHLARRGVIEISQRGHAVDPDQAFRGAIRLRRRWFSCS